MSKTGDWLTGIFGFFFDPSLGVNVLLLAVILTIVSLFIWEFYKSTSKRNLITLDLRKYNTSEHPLFSKLLASFFYLLEYLIVMPILIAFWFTALSVVLLLIAEDRPVSEILLIAAAMITAIRILAYFKGEISKDLAKLFPFIALSFFLLSPGELNFIDVTSRFQEIPDLLGHILSFVFVIFMVEIVLRIFYAFYEFWRSEEEVNREKERKVAEE
jgi:hypothetical protein